MHFDDLTVTVGGVEGAAVRSYGVSDGDPGPTPTPAPIPSPSPTAPPIDTPIEPNEVATKVVWDYDHYDNPQGGASTYQGFTFYNAQGQPAGQDQKWTASVLGANGPLTFTGTVQWDGRGFFGYTGNKKGTDLLVVTLGTATGAATRTFGAPTPDIPPPPTVPPVSSPLPPDAVATRVVFDDDNYDSPVGHTGLHGFTFYNASGGRVADVGQQWIATVQGANGPKTFTGRLVDNGRGVFQYTGSNTGIDLLSVTMGAAVDTATRSYGDAVPEIDPVPEPTPVPSPSPSPTLPPVGNPGVPPISTDPYCLFVPDCAALSDQDRLDLADYLLLEPPCPAPGPDGSVQCLNSRSNFRDENPAPDGNGVADGQWRPAGMFDFPGCNDPNHDCYPRYKLWVIDGYQKAKIFPEASSVQRQSGDTGIVRWFQAGKNQSYYATASVRLVEKTGPGAKIRLTIAARDAAGKQVRYGDFNGECNDSTDVVSSNFQSLAVVCHLPNSDEIVGVGVKFRIHSDAFQGEPYQHDSGTAWLQNISFTRTR